jgi:hypothetical protein
LPTNICVNFSHPFQTEYSCHERNQQDATTQVNLLLLVSSTIYGPKYEDGEWKSKTNRELEELSKGENIVKWIKGQRIRWLGHLERMEEDRMPKKDFTRELEGTRRRGRPMKGQREEVERDLLVLRVRRLRELVIGKNGELLFDRPKPTAGCSANGRSRR